MSILNDMLSLNLTSIVIILWDWLVLIALTLWIGILVIEQCYLTRGRCSGLYPRANKRTKWYQLLCLVILLIGEIIALILQPKQPLNAPFQTESIAEDALNLFIYSNDGRVGLIRIVLLLVAMGTLYWSQRNYKAPTRPTVDEAIQAQMTGKLVRAAEFTPKKTRQLIETPIETSVAPRQHTLLWLILASIIILTSVLSRAAAEVLTPRISAIFFDWCYLVTQGIWLGGFAYLGYVLLPILLGKELEYNTETLIFLLRRLAPLLLVSMGVHLISGLFLGEASFANYEQILNDSYGQALLIQVGLSLVAILLSIYALVIIRPKLIHQALSLPVVQVDLRTRRERQSALHTTGRNLRRLIHVLSVLGILLLLCTALMAFFVPPVGRTGTSQTYRVERVK